MNELTPQVRCLFFTGIITALEKQARRLEEDLESAQAELDQAREEVKKMTTKPAETALQN